MHLCSPSWWDYGDRFVMSSFVCLFCNLEMESLSSGEVGHNILTLTSTWQGKCWQGKSIAIFLVCVGHILRMVVPVFFCSLLCHSFQCSFTWHIHLFMGLSPSTCVLRHLCWGQGTSLDGCPFILLWDWIFCCFTIVNTKITCWQLYQDSHLVLWLANTHYGIQLYVRALGNQAQLSCLLHKTLPTE